MHVPFRSVLIAFPLVVAACGVDSGPLFKSAAPLQPVGGRPGNLPIYTPLPNGAGGSEGTPPVAGLGEGVGTAQQHQEEADAGSRDAGSHADGGADAGGDACASDADCIDNNA